MNSIMSGGVRTVAHNTPSTTSGMVRVHYPYHPLHGREFKLLRSYRRASDTVVVMDPTDRRLTIPHWMTLPDAACIGIAPSAHVSVRSLLLLAAGWHWLSEPGDVQ